MYLKVCIKMEKNKVYSFLLRKSVVQSLIILFLILLIVVNQSLILFLYKCLLNC